MSILRIVAVPFGLLSRKISQELFDSVPLTPKIPFFRMFYESFRRAPLPFLYGFPPGRLQLGSNITGRGAEIGILSGFVPGHLEARAAVGLVAHSHSLRGLISGSEQ